MPEIPHQMRGAWAPALGLAQREFVFAARALGGSRPFGKSPHLREVQP
jgi:hypothetical protein